MSNEYTREWWKERLPLIQAFAEGKRVQINIGTTHAPEWDELVNDPGFAGEASKYRIVPEPKLRPWKPEEVPVGAIVRQKANPQNKVLITAVVDGMVWSGKIQDSNEPVGDWTMLSKCEHSTDGGRTWAPCGVMEEQQ